MAKAKAKQSEKLEFDKDYIFNLIMPATTEAENDEYADGPANTVVEFPAVQESVEEDHIAVLKSKLFARPDTGVKLSPTPNLVLVNVMETLVVEKLDMAFEKFSCCKCDKCKQRVAMMALNTLPAKYVLVDPEHLSDEMQKTPSKEVTDAVIKAILHVKSHPKH